MKEKKFTEFEKIVISLLLGIFVLLGALLVCEFVFVIFVSMPFAFLIMIFVLYSFYKINKIGNALKSL